MHKKVSKEADEQEYRVTNQIKLQRNTVPKNIFVAEEADKKGRSGA